jgi:tetratricopeptide (TPR) repeat protein
MRNVLLPVVLLLLLFAPAGGPLAQQVARAQGKQGAKEVDKKTAKAMENFDLLEFEEAKKGLVDAVALAKENQLDEDPVLARAYLHLGIVEFAGLKNAEAAREAFAAAVAIDPAVEIGVAYRTAAMAELLRAVKQSSQRDEEEQGEGAVCGVLSGVEHTPVDQGKRGQSVPISVRVGDRVSAQKVSLFYRAAGAAQYVELRMRRGRNCTYQAAIPAAVMRGDAVHYYVAALANGQTRASKGSRTSPNIIMLAAAAGEDSPVAAEVSEEAEEKEAPAGEKKSMFFSLAVGTGAGYVSGTTEVVGSEVDCCVAIALLHVWPEIGYYFSRQLSLSGAFRMGFALGANVSGHATAAPSGLLRLRYALSESGLGFQVSASAGGGIIRNTVKVEEAASDMDTDTTASGPFLAGGGIGYVMALSGVSHLVAELSALAAFPGGIDELGPCPGSGCVRPNFGIQADFNLGVLFAF